MGLPSISVNQAEELVLFSMPARPAYIPYTVVSPHPSWYMSRPGHSEEDHKDILPLGKITRGGKNKRYKKKVQDSQVKPQEAPIFKKEISHTHIIMQREI